MAVARALFFLQQERRDCSLIWDGSFLLLNRPATTAAVRIQITPLPGKGFRMMWLGEQAIKTEVLRKEKAMLLLLIFKCITDKCCLKKKMRSPDIELVFTPYSPFNV